MKKLYYENAYLKKADAVVQELRETEGKTWLSLDQSVFFPGGGGQLADKGKINEYSLCEVKEEDSVVWHGLDKKASFKRNDIVKMEIDWSWRYYNMQQHSGQHLISYILDEFDLPTVSVHLGENYTTVEVDGEIPDLNILHKVEKEANSVLRKAIPIHRHLVSREEADGLPLRKPAGEWENLRVVEIEKLDFSACGGTHVNNTAEIGYVKISGAEKIRGRSRIQAYIGQRADQFFSDLHSVNNKLKQHLQIEPEKYGERIQAIKQELSDTKSRMDLYRKEFIMATARKLSEESDHINRIHFRRDDLAADDIQEIAKILSSEMSKVALGLSGERFYLLAPDGDVFDTSNFLKEKGPALMMRGGGPPGFAQGKIESPDDEAISQAYLSF